MKIRLLQTLLGIFLLLLFFAGPLMAKTVNLSWDASPSVVTGYKVYYSTGTSQAPFLGTGATEGASPIDAGNNLNFAVSGLPDDQVHYFAVVAYDAAGNESTYSNIVESSAIVAPPVVTPSGDKDVTLSWDSSPSEVNGYKIYYAVDSSQQPFLGTGAAEGDSPIDVGNVLTSTVTGLVDDKVHYFAVVAYDAAGNESSYSNIVESPIAGVTNNAPILSSIGSKSILENATISFTLSAVDPDGDPLTYSATNLPSGAGFNSSTRTFSWTPGYTQAGSYNVTFSVSDGSLSDSELVAMTVGNVNRAPTLDAIGAKSMAEAAALSFTISGSDPDNDSLSYSATNLPSGAAFNSSTRSFSWTPSLTQGGNYNVTFSVTDGSASDSEVVAISVSEVNQAPVLGPIGSITGAENSNLSFTLAATDADNDSLIYSAANLPTGASFNAATRTFSWTPDATQGGIYSVTFAVTDGSLSDSEVVAINVSDVNRAPVLTEIGTKTVGEGVPLSFTLNASDPDGDGVSFSAANLPSGASFNPETHQFNWTPPFEATENTRIYPVGFTVTDGSLSDSETVTINVTNVNRAPVLAPIGNQTLVEGDILNLIVTASDPDNTSLLYSANNIPPGAVFTPSTRSMSWIPANDQAGVYNVTFSVSDGSLSDSEVVTLTVGNVNQAPVLGAIGSQTVNEGVELSLMISATDPEGDALSFTASGLPEGASFDADQSRFSWTPDYTQAGSFSVTFSVADAALSDSETVVITVVNSNQPPTISGSPATTVMAATGYSFTPIASDPDADTLTFSINNKPAWASFDSATGQLSGTPSEQQVGTTSAVEIGVSDGTSTVSLPIFTIEVQAYVPVDSDGDGVLDHLDAFPNDANEWLDTDGDLIGNNVDEDDDNDGVADIRDGDPQDASKSGWIITAATGSGGFITPEGETSVLYGGSQSYTLTPMAGYYVNDLLVDNVSVGKLTSYQFDNVAAHHSIEAVFVSIPAGLSLDPAAAGLPGVDRVDGGDDSSNLVTGLPKLDLEYAFNVVLRAAVPADQRRVFLVLDGYRYQMQLESGAIASGASYQYVTRLGPAYAHNFHYLVEDANGNLLGRYPQTDSLLGPSVELLDGKNVIGTPGDIEAADLDSVSAFNVALAYRWIPADKLNGSYERVETGGPIKAGEGYILKRAADGTLPSLDNYGEINTASYEINVMPGWNLIANPYKGNVSLADIQVQQGSDAPQSWLDAAAAKLLVDGIYYYLGADWGRKNAFESAAGSKSAVLTPWIGYWIYVNPTDQPIKLLVPRPQQ